MRYIGLIFFIITLITSSHATIYGTERYYSLAETTPMDAISVGDYYKDIFVSQLTTGQYKYTNCVPSAIKMMLNILDVESESVHDIRLKIWNGEDGCTLSDAADYMKEYGLNVDKDYIRSEEEIRGVIEEQYVMCFIRVDRYYHCIVIVDYVDGGYVVLDPLKDKAVILDTVGIAYDLVVYIDKEVADCNLD